MSENTVNSVQPIPPHYYSYESHRAQLEEESIRVEQIIAEEKRRSAEVTEEESRLEFEKLQEEKRRNVEIAEEEAESTDQTIKDENSIKALEDSRVEIEQLLDSEKLKNIEYLQREKEIQIMEEIRLFKESLYPFTPEITYHYSDNYVVPEISINLLA